MLVDPAHNPVLRLNRAAAVLGGLALIVLVALVLIPGAQASSVSVTPSVIHQGEAVTITATPTGVFSDERLQVTTPGDCEYTYNLVGGSSNVAFPTATGWTRTAGSPSGCPAAANTHQSQYRPQGSSARDYAVRVVTVNGGVGTDVGGPAVFQVDMTSVRSYERTQVMDIRSVGWNAGEAINVQIDRPGGVPFKTTPATADASGVLATTFSFPQGLGGDLDLGTWNVKLLSQNSAASGMRGGVDYQSVTVDRTTVVAAWSTQPHDTERMAPPGAVLDLYYRGSTIGVADAALYQRVSTGDLTGGLVDIDIEQFADGQWQDVARGTASFNQLTNRWVVNWFPDAQFDTTKTYRLATVEGKDRFNNDLESQVTSSFQVSAAVVTPAWTVTTPVVERASAERPLDATVSLKYANGQPLGPADLGGDLRVGVYQGGALVAGSDRIGTFGGGGSWNLEAVTLPPDIPLGTATLRIISPLTLPVPDAKGADNTLKADTASPNFTVERTQPMVVMNSFNSTEDPANAFLRGEQILFVVDASYTSGQKIRQADVFGGSGGVGRALLRIVPNERADQIFELDLHFNSATETWEHRYDIKAGDQVGKWRVAALMSDRWGNNHVVENVVSVGMSVTASLSSAEIQRGEDITVSATMTLPGKIGSQSGSANVTIRDATGAIVVDDQPLAPTSTGGFQGTFTLPVDAPLGTYTAAVSAVASKDSGLDTKSFVVTSTGLGLRDAALSDTAVPRLGNTTFQFTISFPQGARLGPEAITPTIRVVDGTGSIVAHPAATHDAVTGKWSVRFAPGLESPLGSYRFKVNGTDSSGNALETTNSPAFTVQPAQIDVIDIQTGRSQYERGDSLRITAVARYANAPTTPLQGATIPVTVRAGDTDLDVVPLSYNATLGKYSGLYTIPLDAPLSSPTAQYGLVVKADAITDGASNAGPVFATPGDAPFSVAPAVLSVEILSQPSAKSTAGLDTINMTFRLKSADGTSIVGPVEGLEVRLLRGLGQVANASVTSNGDVFEATFAIPTSVIGGDYTLLITGTDSFGNEIHDTKSVGFLVAGAPNKDAPGPALPLVAFGLVAVALVVRRRK